MASQNLTLTEAFLPQADRLPGWASHGSDSPFALKIRVLVKAHGLADPESALAVLEGWITVG